MDAKWQDICVTTNTKGIVELLPFFCVRKCILQCVCFSDKFVIIDYTEEDGVEHEVKIPKGILKNHKIVID